MAITKIEQGAIATGAVDSTSLDSSVNDTINNVTVDTVFTGDSITVPSGDQNSRPTPAPGMLRYNSSSGLVENYNSAGWQGIDAPPAVIGIAGVINEDTDSTITITGTNFKTGAIVYVEGDGVGGIPRGLSTTFVNTSTLTANTNASNQNFTGGATFSIKVVNTSGLSGVLDPAGYIDRDPLWTTGSGNIGTFTDREGAVSTTLSASDPDGTNITYSVQSGSSLPSGLSLDANSGVISGDPDDVSGDTTYPFTIEATSNNQTTPRLFNIIINKSLDGSSSDRAAPSAKYIKELTGTTTDGFYHIQTPYMTSSDQIWCDMNNEGGGWMMMFMNQGGTNQVQSGTFYDNINNSTATSLLSPYRHNNSYAYGRSSIWTSNTKNASGVKLMKQYNLFDSSNNVINYSMTDTNTNGITHTNSSSSRQVYDILDLGSSVTPYDIYGTSFGSSTVTLSNAVTLYVDGGAYGGSGGTYNYGSSDALLCTSTSRGFSNNGASADQVSPTSTNMTSWGGRHWIAYNETDGMSRVRCQFICWGSEPYLLEVGMFMKENSTWQP